MHNAQNNPIFFKVNQLCNFIIIKTRKFLCYWCEHLNFITALLPLISTVTFAGGRAPRIIFTCGTKVLWHRLWNPVMKTWPPTPKIYPWNAPVVSVGRFPFKTLWSVVYFDQWTHASACVCMVENDEKHGTFFMIFKCFSSFLTMRTRAQAWVCWSKYTTLEVGFFFLFNHVCKFIIQLNFDPFIYLSICVSVCFALPQNYSGTRGDTSNVVCLFTQPEPTPTP